MIKKISDCFPTEFELNSNHFSEQQSNKSQTEQNNNNLFGKILDEKMEILNQNQQCDSCRCKLSFKKYHKVYFADMEFNLCDKCYSKWNKNIYK